MITILFGALSASLGGFASTGAANLESGISLPIAVHLATALPALVIGAVVLWRPKGTAQHRLLGRIWAGLMLTTAIASAFIRAPGAGIAGTGYSVIHLFTIWTLVSLPIAVWAARKGKVESHMNAMRGLYIGLCVAGAFTLIPGRLLGNWVLG
jgi:uncharacterized membrane protein